MQPADSLMNRVDCKPYLNVENGDFGKIIEESHFCSHRHVFSIVFVISLSLIGNH